METTKSPWSMERTGLGRKVQGDGRHRRGPRGKRESFVVDVSTPTGRVSDPK